MLNVHERIKATQQPSEKDEDAIRLERESTNQGRKARNNAGGVGGGAIPLADGSLGKKIGGEKERKVFRGKIKRREDDREQAIGRSAKGQLPRKRAPNLG